VNIGGAYCDGAEGMSGEVERYTFWKEVVLWKDGDVGRCSDRGIVVVAEFVMIRKWSKVLQCQVM